MFATCVTMGLAEWIIDDTCLQFIIFGTSLCTGYFLTHLVHPKNFNNHFCLINLLYETSYVNKIWRRRRTMSYSLDHVRVTRSHKSQVTRKLSKAKDNESQATKSRQWSTRPTHSWIGNPALKICFDFEKRGRADGRTPRVNVVITFCLYCGLA